MAIIESGLKSSIGTLLFNAISGNIADPSARGVKWIFRSSFPDTKARDFPEYPILVISSPNVSVPEQTYSGNYSFPTDATVGVFSKSAQQCENLSDSITDLFKRTKRGILIASGLRHIRIDESPVEPDMRGDQRLHVCRIPISFEAVI